MSKLLIVSPSPHVHSSDSTQKIMYHVVYAMIPAMAWGIYMFGWDAIRVGLISILSCLAIEFLIQKYVMKVKPSITDGSALITGILLAFNVPADLPWWIIIIGAIAAMGIGKMSFGGLGANIFNPALVGRVFLLISFPVQMTSWPSTRMMNIDGISAATPLAIIKEGIKNGTPVADLQGLPDLSFVAIGFNHGSLGEVSALLLLLGGLYMLWKKVITWQIPVSILLTVVAIAGIFWLIDPVMYVNPVYHIFTGGLMLGAVYMATDMVTSPMTGKAQIIYGVGIGVITIAIRMFGAYPEGISFAILIMNAFVPLLNMYSKPKRFGGGK
jgi:electron transport complex protein RnfD